MRHPVCFCVFCACCAVVHICTIFAATSCFLCILSLSLSLHFGSCCFFSVAFVRLTLSLPSHSCFLFIRLFQMSSMGCTPESAGIPAVGLSSIFGQDDYGTHGSEQPGTPTERSQGPVLQVPEDLLSGPEQAFITWMKACAPCPEKRLDSWWTNLLKVGFLYPLSLSLSFLSLSLSLSSLSLLSLPLRFRVRRSSRSVTYSLQVISRMSASPILVHVKA